MILSINSFLIACQDNLDEAAPYTFKKQCEIVYVYFLWLEL